MKLIFSSVAILVMTVVSAWTSAQVPAPRVLSQDELEKARIEAGYVEGSGALDLIYQTLFDTRVDYAQPIVFKISAPVDSLVPAGGITYQGAAEHRNFQYTLSGVTAEAYRPLDAVRVHADLCGFAWMYAETAHGSAYMAGLWFHANDADFYCYMPVCVLTNPESGADIFRLCLDPGSLFPCINCQMATCNLGNLQSVDDAAQVRQQTLTNDFVHNNCEATLLCGIGAGVVCFTPLVAIPVIGQAACAGMAACAVESLRCAISAQARSASALKAFHNCLCVQAAAPPGSPPGCVIPYVPVTPPSPCW